MAMFEMGALVSQHRAQFTLSELLDQRVAHNDHATVRSHADGNGRARLDDDHVVIDQRDAASEQRVFVQSSLSIACPPKPDRDRPWQHQRADRRRPAHPGRADHHMARHPRTSSRQAVSTSCSKNDRRAKSHSRQLCGEERTSQRRGYCLGGDRWMNAPRPTTA